MFWLFSVCSLTHNEDNEIYVLADILSIGVLESNFHVVDS